MTVITIKDIDLNAHGISYLFWLYVYQNGKPNSTRVWADMYHEMRMRGRYISIFDTPCTCQ